MNFATLALFFFCLAITCCGLCVVDPTGITFWIIPVAVFFGVVCAALSGRKKK